MLLLCEFQKNNEKKMREKAQRKLLNSLAYGCKTLRVISKRELYKQYVKFSKEVNLNVNNLGEFHKAYIYLKDVEFKFKELKKGYYYPKQFPEQLSIPFLEQESLKKNN